MVEYTKVNVKSSNSQLKKTKKLLLVIIQELL